MINVIVTLLGAPSYKFIKHGHAPALTRNAYKERGILQDNGRIFIPADFPIASYWADPEFVLDVRLEDCKTGPDQVISTKLQNHLDRMRETGTIGNCLEWNEFIKQLNRDVLNAKTKNN